MQASRPLTLALAALALSLVAFNSGPAGKNVPSAPVSLTAQAATATEPIDDELAAVEDFFADRRTGLLPSEVAPLAQAIVVESRRAGLPPALVLAVIQVESSGDNFAVSPAGAPGLMQLRPATAEALAARAGVRWRGWRTLFDPVANVRLGVSDLDELLQRFGSVSTALAAYNWGPTRISKRLRHGQSVPVAYAQRVLACLPPNIRLQDLSTV